MIKSYKKNNLGKKISYNSKHKRTEKYVKYKKNNSSKKLRGGARAGASKKKKYRPVYRIACRSALVNAGDNPKKASLRKDGRIMNQCANNEYWHFKKICGIGPDRDVPDPNFLVCKKEDSDDINKKKTIRNRLCADLRSSFNNKCINKTLSKQYAEDLNDMRLNSGEHAYEVNKASRQGRECFNLITGKPGALSRADLREELRVKILQSRRNGPLPAAGPRYPLTLDGDLYKPIFASNNQIDLGHRLTEGALINSNNSSQNINNIRNRWDVNNNRSNTILTAADGACNNAPDPSNDPAAIDIKMQTSQKQKHRQRDDGGGGAAAGATNEEATLTLHTSNAKSVGSPFVATKSKQKQKQTQKQNPNPDPPCKERKCDGKGVTKKEKCVTMIPGRSKRQQHDGYCSELKTEKRGITKCSCVVKAKKK